MVILRQKIKGQPYSQGTESLFFPSSLSLLFSDSKNILDLRDEHMIFNYLKDKLVIISLRQSAQQGWHWWNQSVKV